MVSRDWGYSYACAMTVRAAKAKPSALHPVVPVANACSPQKGEQSVQFCTVSLTLLFLKKISGWWEIPGPVSEGLYDHRLLRRTCF